jgi:hypothetical protein
VPASFHLRFEAQRKRERICWTSAGDIKKKKMIDIQNSQSLIKYDEINENDEGYLCMYMYLLAFLRDFEFYTH